MKPEEHPYLQKCIDFIESIGIKVTEKALDESTFLPGLMLGAHTIYVDYDKLKYPGDILHEAGHIAVSSQKERELTGTTAMPDSWPTQGDEIAAILWSYAALRHLELPIEFVFHPDGYKNHSSWYIDTFTKGNFIGLPLLQWYGMSHSDDQLSEGLPAFPVMQNWIRP
ncbi:hypothetical protein ACX0HA_14715 [Flavobacterium hauense]